MTKREENGVPEKNKMAYMTCKIKDGVAERRQEERGALIG